MHFITTPIATFGRYMVLMGKVFSRPERFRMYWKQYIKEMQQLGLDSIGIVLMISFFIGAVICIQMKMNIQSPWMPRFSTGYTTREILLLEFSSSIMCLILAGKVGSNIASEIGTMRVTQQIDALDIMGVNSASFLILPKIMGLVTMIPLLVTFSMVAGFGGAYAICLSGILSATLLQPMVRVDGLHQILLLRLHHRLRLSLLRLHCRGRQRRGGQGQHRQRRALLHADSFR